MQAYKCTALSAAVNNTITYHRDIIISVFCTSLRLVELTQPLPDFVRSATRPRPSNLRVYPAIRDGLSKQRADWRDSRELVDQTRRPQCMC